MRIEINDVGRALFLLEVLPTGTENNLVLYFSNIPQKASIVFVNHFDAIAQRFMNWSVKTYERSTAVSCMAHLKRECVEVLEETDKAKQLVEFADCFMCLLSAAAREGFNSTQIVEAIAAKAEINYNREWKLNEDDTYSHIK